MQKMKAEETLKYVIETVKSHLRELYDSEVVDTDFIYGEKTAYVECLELIACWDSAEENGLDFDIELMFPI